MGTKNAFVHIKKSEIPNSIHEQTVRHHSTRTEGGKSVHLDHHGSSRIKCCYSEENKEGLSQKKKQITERTLGKRAFYLSLSCL